MLGKGKGKAAIMTLVSRRRVVAGLAGLSAWGLVRPLAAQQLSPDIPPPFALSHGIVRVSRVRTVRTDVAMTFDDGPHPTLTPLLLDMLAERRLKATFYLIGSMVARYPDVARRIVDEGHEVGNHTWRHPFLTSLGDEAVMREIDRTTEAIWQATRTIPHTMRPPYGAMTARQSQMIYAARNLPTVMWSVDTQDWRRPGSSVVARRVVDGAESGAIILAHDIHAPTVAAMPAALDGVMARGLGAITMSQLLGFEAYTASYAAATTARLPVPALQ